MCVHSDVSCSTCTFTKISPHELHKREAFVGYKAMHPRYCKVCHCSLPFHAHAPLLHYIDKLWVCCRQCLYAGVYLTSRAGKRKKVSMNCPHRGSSL